MPPGDPSRSHALGESTRHRAQQPVTSPRACDLGERGVAEGSGRGGYGCTTASVADAASVTAGYSSTAGRAGVSGQASRWRSSAATMAAPRGRLRAACRRAPIPANHGTGCSAPARAAVRLSAAAVRGAVCDALRMSRPAQARAAAIWAAVVVVAASILLAPVITVTGYGDAPDGADRKSTRLNSSHRMPSRMPSSA